MTKTWKLKKLLQYQIEVGVVYLFHLGLDNEPSTLNVTRTFIEKDHLGDESPDEDC